MIRSCAQLVARFRVVPSQPLALGSVSVFRTKTFVRGESKGKKAYNRLVEYLKTQGKEPETRDPAAPETRYWIIKDGMKVYKYTTNGVRNRKHPTRFHLWNGSPIKRLTKGIKSNAGRDGTGKIIVRHRGGGHKRLQRFIDMDRKVPGPHQVVRFEYDPNRTSELAVLRNMSTNEYTYIVCPDGLKIGDVIYSYRAGLPKPLPGQDEMQPHEYVKVGNCVQLKHIPVGTRIHAIACHPNDSARLAKSAGAYGTLIFTSPTGMAHVRLASSEVRMIPVDSYATIGQVGNINHSKTQYGKAGIIRRLGRRPKVRGIAMSPYAHPHGGGRKSKGNKHPRSIWGWKTKGVRTVKFRKASILVPRWRKKVSGRR